MNMRTIQNAVTSRAGRQVLILQKNSPQLLFAGGVIGVVAAGVLACRATLKLEEIIEDAEKDHIGVNGMQGRKYTEMDRKKDHAYIYIRTVSKVTKLYAPSVGLGAVSVAALTGSHVVLTKRNVALTAAYSAVEKAFSEYRQRVIDDVGKDKDEDYRYGSELREVARDTKKGVVIEEIRTVKPGVPSQYAKFFDECSQSWCRQPEYNFIFLRCQQSYFNDLLRARGHVFLNEVYDALGIERTKAGAVVGWILTRDDGDNFIDFGVFDETNERARAFVNGREGAILLDFNVDGVIYDKI